MYGVKFFFRFSFLKRGIIWKKFIMIRDELVNFLSGIMKFFYSFKKVYKLFYFKEFIYDYIYEYM